MSQLTATARVAPRTAGGARRRRDAPQPLRVVPGAAGRPASAVFVALCTALLIGGLLALLLLNTALSQGSFQLHDLQATSGELGDSQDALTQAVDAQRAPASLAARAVKLGMVPAGSPAFLRLSDGKILGVAKPAAKSDAFTVVTAPTPAASSSPQAATPAGPRTTVTTKGDVTTTTVVTRKANGVVETTVTSVDARTKATTSTTTVTTAGGPAVPGPTSTAH